MASTVREEHHSAFFKSESVRQKSIYSVVIVASGLIHSSRIHGKVFFFYSIGIYFLLLVMI